MSKTSDIDLEMLMSAINGLNAKFESFVSSTNKVCDIKFCDWLFEYLEKYRKQYQTPEYYKYTVRRIEMYCVPYFDNMTVSDITTDILQSFYTTIERTNTRDKIRLVINGAFRKAVGLDMITKNPCLMVEVRNHRMKTRRPLTYAEQRLLFKEIKNPMYLDIFFKMCCTGVRLSEGYSVKPENIDGYKHLIYIDLPDNDKKTHNRLIPYLSDLNVSKNKPFLQSCKVATQTYFKRLFDRLHLDLCIHSFRHTFISVCNDIGFNLKWIQETAGHKDVLTTLNTYTKLLDNGGSPIKDYLLKLKKKLKK